MASISFAYSSLCKWELIICVFSCRAVIFLWGGVVRAAAPAHSLHGNLDFLDWAGPCSILSYHRDPRAAFTDGVSKENLKYSDLLLRKRGENRNIKLHVSFAGKKTHTSFNIIKGRRKQTKPRKVNSLYSNKNKKHLSSLPSSPTQLTAPQHKGFTPDMLK